jgi:hypothetical protein
MRLNHSIVRPLHFSAPGVAGCNSCVLSFFSKCILNPRPLPVMEAFYLHKSTHMFKKLFFVLLVSTLSSAAFAQPSPVVADKVYKEWQVLPNSRNMVEVFYCVVKCNGVNKVQLMVFNDGTADSNVEVSLDITNTADGEHFSVTKTLTAKKGVFHKATCDSEALSELKIALPDNYDPAKLSIKERL